MKLAAVSDHKKILKTGRVFCYFLRLKLIIVHLKRTFYFFLLSQNLSLFCGQTMKAKVDHLRFIIIN